MTKRAVFVCFLIVFASGLYASVLKAEAVPLPTGVYLSWNSVEDARYYDIYADNSPVARVEQDDSYTVENLLSSTDYSICIAARSEDGRDLDAEWIDVTTDSWDGDYVWLNKTGNDNRGRMKSMKLSVRTVKDPVYGQYPEIWLSDNDTKLRISPLYPVGSPDSGRWEDYSGTSDAATAYRVNAEKFNTSIFTPSRFRVDRIVIDYDSTSSYIQTSAFGLTVDTLTRIEFFVEDGEKKLLLQTEAEGIAGSMIFTNPNPGEGAAFIFTKI